MNVLYIIIPCYNEETVLPITSKLFLSKLNSLIESGKIPITVGFFSSMMAARIKPGKLSAHWQNRMNILLESHKAVIADIRTRFLRV